MSDPPSAAKKKSLTLPSDKWKKVLTPPGNTQLVDKVFIAMPLILWRMPKYFLEQNKYWVQRLLPWSCIAMLLFPINSQKYQQKLFIIYYNRDITVMLHHYQAKLAVANSSD